MFGVFLRIGSYEDVINVLDEMAINIVPHYALLQITDEEKKVIVEQNGRL